MDLEFSKRQQQEEGMLYIPNTMEKWPWPRQINLHYEEISADSKAWIFKFGNFAVNDRWKKMINLCDASRLAALAYPEVPKEYLRIGCDLMNFFFVIDEFTDGAAPHVVREMVDIMVDAMKNPHRPRPEGEHLLGQIAREFWELDVTPGSPSSVKHFLEQFIDYLESLVIQAEDRDSDRIRTVEEYLDLRRPNIGVLPSFFPCELHLNLPDEAFYHPVICQLQQHIVDMIIIDNDMASYNKEQAVGDDRCNILTIAMHQYKMDLEGAMVWACKYHYATQDEFLSLMSKVPAFSPEVDKEVKEYVVSLANWARANSCWHFESRRYFGDMGWKVKQTRLTPMLPKVGSGQDVDRPGKHA